MRCWPGSGPCCAAPGRNVLAPVPGWWWLDRDLDEDSHEVRRAGVRAVTLTPTEFNLLRFLMVNAGRVLSRAQILDHVWDYTFRGDGGVVEPCVSYLRRKVDQSEPKLIHTVRGVGYVLRIPPP